MKTDSYIIQAIDQFVADKKITYTEFARILGVSNPAVTKWRMVGNGITPSKWARLFPMIQKYLPADRLYLDDVGHEQYSSTSTFTSSYYFEPKYVPMTVPTFTLEQISEYDNTLESVVQLGERLNVESSEYRAKHKDKSSIFAIKIEDNKLAPVLPERTTLFVCGGERPNVNGLCVVMPCVGGETAFIGYYNRTEDEFSVTSVNGKKDRYLSGKIGNAKNLISWIFPVLYYEVVAF